MLRSSGNRVGKNSAERLRNHCGAFLHQPDEMPLCSTSHSSQTTPESKRRDATSRSGVQDAADANRRLPLPVREGQVFMRMRSISPASRRDCAGVMLPQSMIFLPVSAFRDRAAPVAIHSGFHVPGTSQAGVLSVRKTTYFPRLSSLSAITSSAEVFEGQYAAHGW